MDISEIGFQVERAQMTITPTSHRPSSVQILVMELHFITLKKKNNSKAMGEVWTVFIGMPG